MKKITAVLLILIMSVSLFACGGSSGDKSRTATVFAMDTFISVSAYSDEETLESVTRLMLDLDNKLSRTKPESDIGRLNAAGKDPVELSNDAAALLSDALYYCADSDGVFDITVAPVTDLWNINGDNPQIPSTDKLADALMNVNYKYLTVNGDDAQFLCDGMKCDLGGIAKGYAADRANELLHTRGVTSALLEIGSSVYILGTKPDGSEYKVGIRDPEGDASKYVGTVDLKDRYITSSGDYERFFEVGGERYCHIFDTSTGWPVDNELHSVTVITESGTLGDYLSTYLFCLGLENGLRRCRENGISALFITKDKHIYTVGNEFDSFELTAEDYTYEK